MVRNYQLRATGYELRATDRAVHFVFVFFILLLQRAATNGIAYPFNIFFAQ